MKVVDRRTKRHEYIQTLCMQVSHLSNFRECRLVFFPTPLPAYEGGTAVVHGEQRPERLEL